MTTILGINAFHADAAAVLLQGGEVVGAIAEERMNRIKHFAGFPKHGGLDGGPVAHEHGLTDKAADVIRAKVLGVDLFTDKGKE